jgi:hypothetical protein
MCDLLAPRDMRCVLRDFNASAHLNCGVPGLGTQFGGKPPDRVSLSGVRW